MLRRDLIKFIAAATGCAFAGIDGALAAAPARSPFTARDLALLDEIAETILPRTATPGARDAAVGAFIARYSAACYEPAQLQSLKRGIGAIDALMRASAGAGFLQASPAQRQSLLSALDAEARKHAQGQGNLVPHYFTLIKQLTLFGYFTSEQGSTQAMRYRPVPGKYKGCVPYKKGDTSWAG